jgi:chaperone required for assembly of F1-ATPase
LAEGIAEEWRAQHEKIRPETMMLTKLANTAIDRVAANRPAVVEQVLAFARSDLICYRAPGPDELVWRQTQTWDPLLEWAREQLSAPLLCTAGVEHVAQASDALAAVEKAIAAHDDFRLAGLHAAATLTGSAVIALALSAGRLSPGDAFAAAELDEIYQLRKWGEDVEAHRRSRKKEVELIEIARFLNFVSVGTNTL